MGLQTSEAPYCLENEFLKPDPSHANDDVVLLMLGNYSWIILIDEFAKQHGGDSSDARTPSKPSKPRNLECMARRR